MMLCGPVRIWQCTYGVQPKYLLISLKDASSHPLHTNFVGALYNQPIYHWNGPFSGAGERSWIMIPELGIRRVSEELAKMKGPMILICPL